MTARCDWGEIAVADEAQPEVEPRVDPTPVGNSAEVRTPVPRTANPPVDMETPASDLEAWLLELHRREGNLFDCGITCPLRDRNGSNCSACPVSRAHETDGTLDEMRLTGLCRIGAEQERVEMLLMAQRHGAGQG